MSLWDDVKEKAGLIINPVGALNPISGMNLGLGAYDIAQNLGGGDPEAQAEADRLRREQLASDQQLAKDRASLNAVFGNTNYNYGSVPEGIGIAPPSYSDAISVAARRNKNTRENSLTGIYNDILGNYSNALDTQYGRKASDVKAMLAGRGLSTSTVGQSILDRLNQTYDTQEAGFQKQAENAVTSIRDDDQTILSNLLSKLDTGADYSSVQNSAQSALTGNVNSAVNDANAVDLTNLFKAMDELYGQQQYVSNYNRGVQYGQYGGAPTPGSGSSGYSGTVIH